VEEWNDSLLAIFVEGCYGKCGLTILSILFGEAVTRADGVQTRWQETVGTLFPEPVKAAAE
jgi:hypothetical protein